MRFDPENALIHNNLGKELLDQGKLDEAAAEFGTALELDDQLQMAHHNLGKLFAEQKEWDKAIEHYRKAIDAAPKYPDTHYLLGVTYFRADKWQEAIASLQKSMELAAGGDAYDWFFLAMAYWKLGDQEQSRVWYQKAVAGTRDKQPDDQQLRRLWTESADLLGEQKPGQ